MGRNNAERFYRALERLEQDPNVARLRDYRQHRGKPTFVHCRNVALCSFRLAQRLGWSVDEDALARGAMLHDYHLYTRKEAGVNAIGHAFGHPKRARENAELVFELNGKEKNIIESHMWPLTLFTFPRSREAFLVTLADKYCALREFGGLSS